MFELKNVKISSKLVKSDKAHEKKTQTVDRFRIKRPRFII